MVERRDEVLVLDSGASAITAICRDTDEDGTCDADENPETTPAVGCELLAPGAAACESDGAADLDETNTLALEEVGRSRLIESSTEVQLAAKLSF